MSFPKNLAKVLQLCLLTAGALLAQNSANKGDIAGTVYDPSRAVITNASVTATNTATGLTRQVPVNTSGQYRLLRLDPGMYSLTATAPNFAESRIDGIMLDVGAALTIDISMAVEGSTTTIDVTASLINTGNTSPSTGIGDLAITNLPINGRRFQDFATLTPTVQIEPERQMLSFAGQRGVNGNVMLDGGDYNNPFFGGIRGGERANFAFTVPQGAVEQFEVVTTGYSAEYGRSTGGLLNVITKGGSNEIHGSAFWQYRDGALSRPEPIRGLTSGETQHQFGGTFGGPIVQDKLFYFGSIERQDAEAPRQVLFTRLTGVTPTPEQQEAFDFYNSKIEPFTSTNVATAGTIRADYQTSNAGRLTLRYNFSDGTGNNAVNTGNAIDPVSTRSLDNDGTEKDRSHTGTVQFTHIFSPELLNDLRFTGTYEERPRLANSTAPNISTLVGNTGNRNFLPTTEDDIRYQIADSLSWTRGAHTMKLGFDYNFVNAAQKFGFNQFGTFTMSVGGTAAAVLRTLELLGAGGATPNRLDFVRTSAESINYQLQIGNLEASMDMHQSAFFAQDSWRVNPDLTLNFGLRWEGQFNPDPEATNTALVDQIRGKRSTFGAILDPAQIPDATNQWMPRFGFAWSPSDSLRRFVVRGHTGIFYASTPLLLFADASNNFRQTPGNLSIRLDATATSSLYQQFQSVGVDLNSYSLDNFPVLTPEQASQAFSIANNVAPNPFAGATVGFVATDFRNPRSFQVGLGAETELTRNLVASIDFNYVNTVHLQRNRDHNLPFPVIDNTSLRPRFLVTGNPRPIPTLGAFNVRESSARGMYRGVTFKLEHRGPRLTAGAFYTLAENFTDDDNERSSGGLQSLDQTNLTYDYGYSRIDMRHQFNSYAVYSLPWGFQVTGSFVARSGLPVNPTTGADTNLDFCSFCDRPYSAAGVPIGRMSFRNRAVVTANNLRVLKNFNLNERMRVQLSAEMFNLFDIDNVVYGSNFGDDTYGLGINLDGTAAPINEGFRRLRLADGSYDPQNRQEGGPFQAQFGLRLFF